MSKHEMVVGGTPAEVTGENIFSFIGGFVKEISIPRPEYKKIPIMRAGFLVGYKEEEKHNWSHLRYNEFLEDSKEGEFFLSEKGITPLAAIPINAWHRICLDSGLFRFHPSDEGMINVNTSSLPGYIEYHRRSTDYSDEQILKRCLKGGDLYRFMFPDGETPDGGGVKVAVTFPDPPAHILSILQKTEEMELEVTASLGAISFKDDVIGLLQKIAWHQRNFYYKKSREQWIEEFKNGFEKIGSRYRTRPRSDCPIISYYHKDAVFILGQYGDCPIEKEVVRKALDPHTLFGY